MKLRARENSYERVLEMATTTKTATKKTTAKTTAKKTAEKVAETPKLEEVKVKSIRIEAANDAPIEENTERMFSEIEVKNMIARAVADAMAKANTSPSVIQVESKTEYVTLQYIGGIAEITSAPASSAYFAKRLVFSKFISVI